MGKKMPKIDESRRIIPKTDSEAVKKTRKYTGDYIYTLVGMAKLADFRYLCAINQEKPQNIIRRAIDAYILRHSDG